MSDIVALQIRYDGRDAERHEIELGALGESLKGVARVVGIAGNFAVTGRLAYHTQAMDVRVMVKETKANCFSLITVLQFAQQHGLLQGGVPALITALVSIAIARASRNKEEMKHLSDNLAKAIELSAQGNAETVSRMSEMVENVVAAMAPGLRQAVEPVGVTCASMRIGHATVITESIAASIREEEPEEYDVERDFVVRLTELDLENATAKVRFEDADASKGKRIRAVITDPVLAVSPNPYLSAFVSGTAIKVRAKVGLRDGSIVSIFISNTPG